MKLGKLYQEINIEEIEVDRDRQLLLDRHLQYFLTVSKPEGLKG
jgi:hypothetical protein